MGFGNAVGFMSRGTSSDLQFRVLDTAEDIAAAGPAWRALEQSCATRLNYFQTFGWCRAWVEAFPDSATPRIVTAWRGKDLVAVWPLMITEAAGLTSMTPLGSPLAQYCDLILDPAHMGQADVEALVAEALQPGLCDVAEIGDIPATSPLASALALREGIVAGRQDSSFVFDLSAFESADEYAASLGKRQRSRRARRRRAIAKEHGEVGFEVIFPGHRDFISLLRRAIAMKRVWLAETGRMHAGLLAPGTDSFFAGLPGNEKEREGAMLSVLSAGGKPIAIELGFLRAGHYYAYLGAFDWNLRHLSPGKVQMESTVCWLIEHGIEAYDLLTNAADYKESWSNRSENLVTFAQPFSWKGRIYAEAWMPTLRPIIKRMYYAVPGSIRRWMTGLQAACAVLLLLP